METGAKAGKEHGPADQETEKLKFRHPGRSVLWPTKASTANLTLWITWSYGLPQKPTADFGSAYQRDLLPLKEYMQDVGTASSSPEDTGELTPPPIF